MNAVPRPGVRALCAATALFLLAACGSTMTPDEVARANGGAAGYGPAAAGDAGAAGPGADASGEGAGGVGATDGDAGAGASGRSGGAGATGAGGAGTSAAAVGTGANSATGGKKAASCDGFKNQTGVTDKEIRLGNSSDISGPVPGLFAASQKAAAAYVAYFNSANDVCGRKLVYDAYDTRFDAGGDQVNYTKMCANDFAAIGSMSAVDSGGAATAEKCGLPDVRVTPTSPNRESCKSCFGILTSGAGTPKSMFTYWTRKQPSAVKSVAMIYGQTAAAQQHTEDLKSAAEKLGWKVTYTAGIDPTEFNYAPYVQQLKAKDVKFIYFTGGAYQQTVKMQKAIEQDSSYKKPIMMQDALIYQKSYIEEAGSAGDGTYVFATFPLFDDTSNKEMVLYRTWLQRTSPGAEPDYFGLYAWSAARLAVQKMFELGGKLDRASLVGAVAKTNDWTANGLHVAQPVGTKGTSPCLSYLQLRGGKFTYASGRGFMCEGVI